ncbi:DUF1176 domain-containing protein [uncultured Psychrobacter sp.]|uniref:DUF1176 domain-containing protein n=1 Tax=Psychrobacter sp. DM8 TaxID=3440636 RepID=UPI00293D859C|nr:DUF1176 domain-containing protein [uncultured Psychrobacter sp.]
MWRITAISTAFMLSSFSTQAATSLEFTQQDWQAVCDNTRTCRLAGYQAEGSSEQPVSILLVRRAGVDTSVEGKVKFGGAKESSSKALMQLGNRHRISLFIDNKDLGEIKPLSSGDADLTAAQVNALVTALAKSSKIELVLRNTRWQLSDKGATAAMMQVDAVQGRVGTPSALIGSEDATRSNTSVLSAAAAPSLNLVLPSSQTTNQSTKFVMRASNLAALLKPTLKDSSDCPNIADSSSWQVARLSSTKLLVQHNCWSAVYNSGAGAWVINDRKPYNPQLVTTNATEYKSGKISAVQKGRSLGDCLSKTDWIWNGKRFVKSHESTTGLCRMVSVGGAWQLPTYVSDVKIIRQ